MHRLTEIALRWPKMTLLVAVVGSLLAAASVTTAPRSSGAHALLGEKHPAVAQVERFLASFGGGYPAVVAWSCMGPPDPCTSIFDEPSLKMADQLAQRLLESPHTLSVSGPAHTPILFATGTGVASHRFVTDGVVNVTADAVEAALSDPLWHGTLISADGRVGAIIVESIGTAPDAQTALVTEIERHVREFEARGFDFAVSGNPVFHVASQREATAETALVGTSTGLVILLLLLVLTRSWQSVFAILLTISMATAYGLGSLSILGWPWDPLTSAAPTMILVMGCADGIHFTTSYWRARADGRTRVPALLRSTDETMLPCLLTTATSGIGLLSFLGTESAGFARFGALTAVGVWSSLLLTFTVIPSVLVLLPNEDRFAVPESVRWKGISASIIDFPIRHSSAVLLVSLAAACIGVVGLTLLNADAHPLSYWREGHPTREDIEFVSDNLVSIEGLEVGVSASSAISDGSVLKALTGFQGQLAALDHVRSVRSVFVLLDRSTRALGGGGLTVENIGEALTLLAMSGEPSLDQWVSLDMKTVRFSIATDSMGMTEREGLLADVSRLAAGLPTSWSISITGPSALQSSIDRVVRSSALQAFAGATLLVAAVVILFLGSVGWGVLAMIPNVLPMVVLFGLMGFAGIALDAGTALVAPIAIGIAVDDTIHFLHAFREERETGTPAVEAARRAGARVVRAVVTTSVTLATGFLAMLVSRFESMSNMGLMSASAIVAAFFAEILVLPALITSVSGTRLYQRVISRRKG